MLFSGTTIAQLIPFLISPILTRQFEPWQFGQVAFFNAILFPLIVLSTLRTELTLPLPDNDDEARSNAITGIILSVTIASVFGLFGFVFRDSIADLFELSGPTRDSLIWIGPAIVAGGIMQLTVYWQIRMKTFRRVSYTKVSQTAATGGTSLGIGAVNSSLGLLPGEVIGRGVAGLFGLYQATRSGFSLKGYPGVLKGFRSLFSRYRSFVVYNSIPAFLDTLSLNMPVLIASAAFNESTLGYFNFSRLVVGAPISLISISVGQAFLPKLAEKCRQQQSIWPTVRRNFLLMIGAGHPIALVAYFISEEVFAFVFGKGWGEAGIYTAILAFPYLAKFVVAPMSISLTALERMNVVSIWQLINFISLGSLFFVPFTDPVYFVKVLAIVELGVYLLYFILIYLNIRSYERNIAKDAG